MKITKLKKDEPTVAPCFTHDHPKNIHKSSGGWSSCNPGVSGLVIRLNTAESQCQGTIITDNQLYEAGYVDLGVLLGLIDCLRVKDLKRILCELELPTSGNKNSLIDRILMNFRGSE